MSIDIAKLSAEELETLKEELEAKEEKEVQFILDEVVEDRPIIDETFTFKINKNSEILEGRITLTELEMYELHQVQKELEKAAKGKIMNTDVLTNFANEHIAVSILETGIEYEITSLKEVILLIGAVTDLITPSNRKSRRANTK